MSDNFQSYQAYEAPTETFTPAPQSQVRVVNGAERVSTTNGIVTAEAMTTEKGSSAQLNPFPGTDTWQATAINLRGGAVTALTPETSVTIGGLQASIAVFIEQGILTKAADGSFKMADAATDGVAPQVDPQGMAPISDASMQEVNAALDPVPQEALDGLAATGIGAALGRLDQSAVVQKFMQTSGLGSEEAHARVAAVTKVYQAQTDGVLTGRFGLAADDLPAFYAHCRTNRQGQMQEALSMQLHAHDVSRWGVLANEWQTKTAPSVAALNAAGITTRKQGNGTQAFIRGSWMSLGAASRAGLI